MISETLSIDITETPPTQEALDQFQEKAANARLLGIALVVAPIISVIISLIFAGTIPGDEFDPSIVLFLSLLGALGILISVAYLGERISDSCAASGLMVSGKIRS